MGGEMALDPKFGFVALLDALGTRTSTLENAQQYLASLELLKDNVQSATDVTLEGTSDDLKAGLSDLKPRFFGDSILLTYSILDEARFEEYFKRILFVLSFFVLIALKNGILLRGALAIGRYLEESNVVLGPAVYDAAGWYEEPQLVSVMLTPKATHYVKGAFGDRGSIGQINWDETDGVFLYDVPTRQGAVDSYVVNWPSGIGYFKKQGEDSLAWFHKLLRDFDMPKGTENKYTNTALLIRRSVFLNQENTGNILKQKNKDN
jgi:hypothetical protein